MVVAILDKKELNNKYLDLNISTKIDINNIYMDVIKSIDIKVNLDYLSLSDKVVLLIANISNCKEKNILIDKLFRYLDTKNTKKVIEFLKKQKNKNIYILEDEDFLMKYINKLLIDDNIVNLEEYFKDNNLSSLYEITDILRKKNIKIMYNKDYRDFIKDVYKNVSKKN
jgi:hypothetical protein